MSESKVPLPEPQKVCWIGHTLFSAEQMRSYGDARAAEARRLALLEAADEIESDPLLDPSEADRLCKRLRALADERSTTEQPADRRFLGVYMSPDGPITIDRQATVDQLLDVIEALHSDLRYTRSRANADLDMICGVGAHSSRRPEPGQ